MNLLRKDAPLWPSRAGGTIQHVYDRVLNGCALIVSGTDAPGAFTALTNNPTVSAVELDQVMSIYDDVTEEQNMFNTTNNMVQVSAAVLSWGLDRINQCSLPLDEKFFKQDAKGVMVFIIDTGIYEPHEEFNGIINKADDCHVSYIQGGDALNDDHGHG